MNNEQILRRVEHKSIYRSPVLVETRLKVENITYATVKQLSKNLNVSVDIMFEIALENLLYDFYHRFSTVQRLEHAKKK